MRTVWFAICFSVGITLMAISGYLPQAASARGGDAARNFRANDTPADGPMRTIVPPIPGPAPAERAPAPGPPPQPTGSKSTGLPRQLANEPARPDPGPAEPVAAVEEVPLPPARPAADGSGPPTPAAIPERLEPAANRLDPPVRHSPDASIGRVDPLSDPPPSAERLPKPVAAAGPDRSVWIGWDELRLEASESRGAGLMFQWRQTGGPAQLLIRDPQAAVTTACGLLVDWKPSWTSAIYRFELTVTDANGEQDTDTVEYTVKPAPTLKLKPAAERRFELRDGYQFPLFALTQTNTESFEAVFEIASDTELTLTRVGGSPSAVVPARADKGHVYLVTVYAQHGAPSSWTEYLVNTAERVPAILQLTVHWVRPAEPE